VKAGLSPEQIRPIKASSESSWIVGSGDSTSIATGVICTLVRSRYVDPVSTSYME
jgi:hypothetical protein